MSRSGTGPRVLLLTGASGGLGRALVRHWSTSQHQLALHCHRERDALEEQVASVNWNHPPQIFQADLSEADEVRHLCGEVQKKLGGVDILINNAGISHSQVLWKQELEDWNRLMALNLTAPFLMMRHLVPGMRSRSFGRIVNISSVVAQMGVFGATAYGASKAGLIGLGASAAKELVSKGITVNTIALGYMEEGMIKALGASAQEEIVQKIPAHRWGETAELAALIDYLTSEKAAYFTGQTVHLNGGLYG